MFDHRHAEDRTHRSSPSKRRRTLKAVAALAVVGAVVAGGTLAYAGETNGHKSGDPVQAQSAKRHHDAVQKAADRLVEDDGFPAVLAAVKGSKGPTRDYIAGVGDLKTGEKVPVNGRVRAASNTKSFTATVVLQLVGEGKVKLDEPIETYLPGLVRGEGIDGRKITVRQVLQHTSGLPDYTHHMDPNPFKTRNSYREARDLIDSALEHKAKFEPGAKWEYSNTNYILAGLLIQKVTDRPVSEEITNRIIRPLKLKDTYWPHPGERGIRGDHPKGYATPELGGKMADITKYDPSMGGAAGQLISSPRDLNTFFSALLGGDLLRPAELKEMKETVESPGGLPDARYGLGLEVRPLPCGGDIWGHGGDIFGYETRGGVTEDGSRAVTVAVTALPTAVASTEEEALEAHENVLDMTEDAICEK